MWPLLETLELISTAIGVVVPVKMVSPDVIDAGSGEIGTGPTYPPLAAGTALLPELLFSVVKPEAVLVFEVLIALDALWIFDAESVLAALTAGFEPVEPVRADPFFVEPPPTELEPVDPPEIELLFMELVPVKPALVDPLTPAPGQSLVTVTVTVTVAESGDRASRIGDPSIATELVRSSSATARGS